MGTTQTAKAQQATASLGLHVVLRWGGDVLVSRFFARPTAITLGEDGTLTLPADVLGGAKRVVLVEPHDEAGFALRLDCPVLRGTLTTPAETVSIDQLRAAGRALQTARVPLGDQVRAELVLGDFALLLSRTPQPAPLPRAWWGREQVGLLACTLLAVLAVGGPLLHGLVAADARRQTLIRHPEALDNALADYVEVAVIERLTPVEVDDPLPVPAIVGPHRDHGPRKVDQPPNPLVPPRPTPPQPLPPPAPKPSSGESESPRRDGDRTATPRDKVAVDEAARRLVEELGVPAGTDPNAPKGPRWDQGAAATPAPPRAATDDPQFRRPDHGAAPDSQPEAPGPSVPRTRIAIHQPLPELQVPAKPQTVVRISRDPANVDGGLGKDTVRQYMEHKQGALRSCYQKNLQSNPELRGDLIAHFLIEPNGAVAGVRLESTMHDAGMESCVRNNIASWRFPAATNGAATEVRKRWSFWYR